MSLVPDKPIQQVGEWAWGKLVNGFVYIAPQTYGGGEGRNILIKNSLFCKQMECYAYEVKIREWNMFCLFIIISTS